MHIADGDLQAAARLWCELGEFPAAQSEQALAHALREAARILGAANAAWIGTTRAARPHPRDRLRGWLPRRAVWLCGSEAHLQYWSAIQSLHAENVVDPQTAAMVLRAGSTRACLRPELLDDRTWEASWIYQDVLRPVGVADRLLAACAVAERAESYLVFDREPGDAPFGERERDLCRLFMLGSTAFHREQMQTHGYLGAQTPLTPRERTVLQLLLTDLTEAEIAAELKLSWGTTHKYIGAILQKFGVRGRAGLTAAWLRCPPAAFRADRGDECSVQRIGRTL